MFAITGITGNVGDRAALAAAFKGAQGVFVLVPPVFDPALGFPEAQARAATLRSALESAHPERVVYLSTIGAQVTRSNLLTQHTIIERALHRRATTA
jgi:NAD(P)H dehydrogenase (quinone)